jgi:hypothetical protein
MYVAAFRISIFNPRNGLAGRVRRGKADLNPLTEVSAVNAGEVVAAHHHHEDGFGSGVCFIVSEFAEHPQSNTTRCLRPMAVLTCFSGRHETITLQCRWNRSPMGIECSLHKLSHAVRLCC